MTITGNNLAGATAVHFGTKLATITGDTPTSVTVTSPSGSGAVDVTVTTPGGTSNPLPFFYVGAPFKSSLSASSGPLAGGNTITVNGTGLSTATVVHFGADTAAPTVVSDSLITVPVPAGGAAGSVEVSPASTLPSRSMAPASKSSRSVRLVLLTSTWASTPMFRVRGTRGAELGMDADVLENCRPVGALRSSEESAHRPGSCSSAARRRT